MGQQYVEQGVVCCFKDGDISPTPLDHNGPYMAIENTTIIGSVIWGGSSVPVLPVTSSFGAQAMVNDVKFIFVHQTHGSMGLTKSTWSSLVRSVLRG